MQPGVLYAIMRNGMPRPGYIFDAKTERIRARVYWTWPGTLWPYDEPVNPERLETDYLNPTPDLLDPRSKYDDNLIVKTSDVIGEWEPWATAEKADRAARLQARLDEEAQATADKEALEAESFQRIEALRDLLPTGYPGIDQLRGDVKGGYWTRDRYSARDVIDIVEHAVRKMTAS